MFRVGIPNLWIAMVLGLTACSSTPGPARPNDDRLPPPKAISVPHNPPSASVSSAAPAPADIKLPLDAYMIADAESQAETKASDLLIADCMKHAGFSYVTERDPHPLPTHANAPYGPAEISKASQLGYQNGKKITMVAERPAYQTPAYLMALQGWVKADGATPNPNNCTDKTYIELHPNAKLSTSSLAFELRASAENLTASDHRVTELTKQWSDCLAGKGFHYASPADAAKAFRKGIGMDTTATALEKTTAIADVQCKQKINFVATWLGVQTAYENLAIQQNSQALDEIAKYDQDLYANWAKVLREHGQGR